MKRSDRDPIMNYILQENVINPGFLQLINAESGGWYVVPPGFILVPVSNFDMIRWDFGNNPRFVREQRFEKWNELPPEIKLECIKYLDIKTRWNLRKTSKTERSLVNSQKFNINKLSILTYEEFMDFRLNGGESSPDLIRMGIECIHYINFILKHAVFDTIEIKHCDSTIGELTEWFPKNGFISVKNLEFFDHDIDKFLFWIDKANDRLKSVTLKTSCPKKFKDELLTYKKITNIHFLHDYSVYPLKAILKLTQIWIKADAEIGKMFQGSPSLKSFESFEDYEKTFSKRLISKKGGLMRIRTDNREKHILMGIDACFEWIRMTVISSKMKESEYDISGEWMNALAKSGEKKPIVSNF